MTEYAGYAYFAEIPGVIWDIQRMGPSTGLPTRTSQGDILMAYYLGHGDTRHVRAAARDMEECFEFGWRAFDLAERLQTPIFVLSDLDLGMNLWMSAPVHLSRQAVRPRQGAQRRGPGRGSAASTAMRMWTATASAIARSPAPSIRLAAYFTRGSGHNAEAQYTERADEWEAQPGAAAARSSTTRARIVPKPVLDEVAGAEIGIISYGSNDTAIAEARDMLANAGRQDELSAAARPAHHRRVQAVRRASIRVLYVVENNFDGQMAKILQTEAPSYAAQL